MSRKKEEHFYSDFGWAHKQNRRSFEAPAGLVGR
jgi:hypothetical protein